MTPFITEILDEINKDPNLLLTKHKDNYSVTTLLRYAFDIRGRMLLPEGEPPFKPDQAPLGMSPANFYQQVKKFYIFTRKDLTNMRREQLFIQLLESLHPTEAKVVIAVKDQNLTSLYPNITADLLVKAGLVPQEHVFRQPMVQGQEVAQGVQHVVNLQDGTATETTEVKVEKKRAGRPKKVVEQPKAEPVVEAPVKRKAGRPKKVAE